MVNILVTSVLVWAQLLLPGLAWLWLFPKNLRHDDCPINKKLYAGTCAILLGVLLTGISTLISAEAGIFTPHFEIALRIVIVLTGLIAGFCVHRKQIFSMLVDGLPLTLLMLLGIATMLALPQRGEWIAGGWDPGVYAGQGVALSRTGTLYPDDSFFYELFTSEEQQAFTRSGHGRNERFPAVLVAPERQAFTFEFFRFTPSLFGAIHRAGGLPAILRANHIIPLFLLPVFFVLLQKHIGRPTAIFATGILSLQPIFLYHTHWPLTEPIQLFLICGMLYLTINQPMHRTGTTLASLLIAATVLNRFSFLPFFGIVMLCLACGEAREPHRKRVFGKHAIFTTAACIAALINYHIAPASLRGWTDIGLILTFSALTTAGALMLDLAFSSSKITERIQKLRPMHIDIAGVALLLLIAVSWLARAHIGTPADATNLQRLRHFTGITPLLLSVGGLIAMLFAKPRIKASIFFPLCMFFLTVGWMMILRKSIMDWFPWATRRYYQTLMPFIAMSGGYLLATISTLKCKRIKHAGLLAAGILLFVLAAESLPTSYRAWHYTSYNGLSTKLEKIAQATGPRDIIITDHPVWGAPLALIYDINVLNGRELWTDESGKRMKTVVQAMERLKQEDWNFYFLTGSDQTTNIYPIEQERFVLKTQFEPYEYQTIIQHPKADRFALETHTAILRLFTFE